VDAGTQSECSVNMPSIPSTSAAVSDVQRQRKSGTEKAYPNTVKTALANKDMLRCNRRGIVSLSSGSEKPSMSVEELLENRRRGMSYASIGRKLGIDPSKDEVLNVYRAIKEVDSDTPDIEKEDVTVLKHYPTPLWFLWRSEADIIAKECIPNLDSILCMGISSRIVTRLGEDASTKLAAFVEVSEIMTEEVGINLTNVDRNAELGKILAWSNNLQSKVVLSCGALWSDIGKSALQQTPDAEAAIGRGRCRCGSSKALRCSWHGGVNPSFFWGCRAYTRFDQARHDKAIGVRAQPFQTVITTPRFSQHLLESEMKVMVVRLDAAKAHYANEMITDEVTKAKQVFGDNFPEDVSARGEFFLHLKDEVLNLLSQRNPQQPAINNE